MSDIRKLLDILNESSSGGTSAGSVAPMAQSFNTEQRRVEEEKTPAPEVIEYGMWENSALATTSKLKKSRGKSSKVVKSIYGEDVPSEAANAKQQAAIAIAKKKEVAEGKFTINAKTGAKLDPRTGAELPPKEKPLTMKDMFSQPKSTAPKLTLDDVWREFTIAASNVAPDIEPYEDRRFAQWLKNHGITGFKIGEILDRAAKKHGYDSWSDYSDSIRQYARDNMAEMDNRTSSGDRREQRNNSPEAIAQREKEQQQRLKQVSPEMRKKLRLPEPKEGVAEGSTGKPRYVDSDPRATLQHAHNIEKAIDNAVTTATGMRDTVGIAELDNGYVRIYIQRNVGDNRQIPAVKSVIDKIYTDFRSKDWFASQPQGKLPAIGQEGKITPKQSYDYYGITIGIPKQGVAEGSTSKEKQKTPYRDINSPEYKAAAEKQKEKMAKDQAAEPGKKLLGKIEKKGVAERADWGGPLYDPDLQKGKKKPKLSDIKVKFPPKPLPKNPVPKEQGVAEGTEELDESDLILNPASISKAVRGLVPHSSDRTDHEIEMAKSDLYQAGKNAVRIYELIKDRSEEEGLEGWVQEKITKAADYLNTIAEYLEGKQLESMDGVGPSTKMFTSEGEMEEGKTGPGLWANIHAKRERIKKGSGERMRKPGSKGAPTASNFKSAQAGTKK